MKSYKPNIKTHFILWRKINAFMIPLLMVIMFFSCVKTSQGQNVSTYSFTQTTGTYSSIGGTGLTLQSGSVDDGYYSYAPIGFTFNYHGANFTQFSANTNGCIYFDNQTTGYSLSSYANCIAYCGGDGKVNSTPIYATTGTSPSRVLTIQFTSWYIYYSSTTNYVSVQVKLYEGTNVIEVIYGPSARATTYTRQVGLTGATTGDFAVRTSTTSWATSSTAGTNNQTMTWSTSYYPASGQIYRWSPPLPGDNCSNAQDLAGLTSPYSGTTIGYADDISICKTGAPDRIFYINVPNGYIIDIWESSNGYDEYEYMGYGASCPGAQITCWDNDVLSHNTWTNSTGSTQTVWYIQDGYSNYSGTFNLQWTLTSPCTPPAAVTVSGGTTQCGGSATLTASGGTGGTIYWQGTTSGGTSLATPSTSQSVSTSGTYYFRSYNSSGGCWGTQGSATVTINTVPAVVTVSGGGTFCGSRTLTASGGAGGTVYWQGTTSGGTSTATPSTSQSVSTSGTYYFRSYNSSGGCWGTQGSATVTINTIPTVVTVSGGGTYCGSTTLTASGGTGGTIYWQGTTSNGTSTATPSTSQSVSSSGTYYFRSYNSSGGCWGTQGSASVTINSYPTAVVSPGSVSAFCYGSSATLTGSTGCGSPSYVWFRNGTSTGITSTTYSATTPGSYTVQVTCNGCASISNTVTVSVSGNSFALSTTQPATTGLSSGDYVWSGNTTTNWSTPVNWLQYNGSAFSVAGAKPTSANNVYIRSYGSCATNTCTLAASERCNNITIESGKTLAFSGAYSLLVSGNWTNSGTFTASTGTVNFGFPIVRYIKLTQQIADWTNLSELQAFEAGTGTNVAIGSTATESSYYSSGYQGSYIIDNNLGSIYHSGTSNIGEWVKVDLVSGKNLDHIVIHNRGDCCWSRSQSLLLELFDASNVLVYSKIVNVWENVDAAHSITINLNSNSDIAGSNGTTFYNVTVSKTGSAKAIFATQALNAGGSVNVTSGTLEISKSDASSSVTGDFNVNSGATFNHNANWNGSDALNVSGNAAVDGTYSSTGYPLFDMVSSGTRNVRGNYRGYLCFQNGTFNANGTIVCQSIIPMWSTGGAFHTNGNSVSADVMYGAGGTMYVDGGSFNVSGAINVAYWSINSAFNLSSGSATCGNFIVGDGTGIGIVTHSGGTLNVTGNYSINSSCFHTCSNGPSLNITGNWTNNGTFTPASSNVTFNGTTNATLGGSNTSSFYNLAINKTVAGNNKITLNKDITITNTATFSNGYIVSSATPNGLVTFSSSATAVSSASMNSFIDGPVRKTGNTVFTFPTGDIQGTTYVWAPIGMTAPANVADAFTAEYRYYTASPTYPTWNTGTSMGTGLHHVSGKEYWMFDRTTGTSTPAITLHWKSITSNPLNDHGFNNTSDITIAHWNTSTSKWEKMCSSETINGDINNGYLASNITFPNYSPITFGSKNNENPLPVSLTNFSGNCTGSTVDLHWTTAIEINNDYFTIEKSNDGQLWKFVAKVQGSGNSNTFLYYSAVDNENIDTYSFYRLSQTDYDGTTASYNPITVYCNQSFAGTVFSVYPNPVTTNLNVTIRTEKEDSGYIILYDALGKEIYMKPITLKGGQENTYIIDLSKYARGNYYLNTKLNYYTLPVKKITTAGNGGY
ncbi:MAG TPA: hypothetical protein DEH02_00985 [Bacteroidales bacterium]|nr:hypothetical protein [Bacteroidales bacterium]